MIHRASIGFSLSTEFSATFTELGKTLRKLHAIWVPMKAPALLIRVVSLLLLSMMAGFGHGSMASPISRSYEVFLENPEHPSSDAGKAAVAVAGTQAFYDWMEVNRQLPNHDYRTQIPDGTLPGAGRDKYAGLNLARTDWPATKVTPGKFHCVFYAATPHDPSYFEAYITKAGYDPRQPLKWSDLEALPGGETATLQGKNYVFDVTLPQRTGRHILYVIWQRIDPVGEVFFSTSDIDFGGVNYGTASPTPMVAPDYSGTATSTPTPTPTPAPSATPVPGAGSTVFENDTVKVTFKLTSDWISGFQSDVTIENKTSTLLRDWTLSYRWTRDATSPWNARVVSKVGDRTTFDAQPYTWNKDIAAKGKVSFGFTGAPGGITAAPTDFIFTPSSGTTSPTPTPTPSPTATPTPTPVPTPTPTPTPVPTPTPTPVPTPTPTPTPVPTPTPTPTPTQGSPNTMVDLGNVSVSFKVSGDWISGFQGDVVITNKTSSVLKDWQLSFTMDRAISSIWNARTVTTSGSRYTFDAQPFTWNKDIPANGSVSFGFVGSPGNMKTPPTNFAFSPTSGGTSPTPTPTPTPTPIPTPTPTPTPVPTPTPIPTPTPTPTPVTPKFSIADAVVDEPTSGTTTVDVPVTLSVAQSTVVGVSYQTADGTAIAGSDYNAANGSLLFEPGTTTKTIPIVIRADTTTEGAETFTVTLTAATGADIARSVATVTIRPQGTSTSKYNYAEALQKAVLFYDAQRSGALPANKRLNWRGDSAMSDGSDVGVDLTGGYYDAGDHVKFGLPMTSSMTLLAWGGIEYTTAYSSAQQKAAMLDAVRWGTDWIIKAHPSDNVFYGQVGTGGTDHSFWGPPEVMTMARAAYKIDSSHPGTEVAGEAAAALASASILFKTEDPTYSAKLLQHARTLFAFADNYRGTYTNAIPDAASFYNSYSGYNDELVWAAAWMYRATGEVAYLQKAEALYQLYFNNVTLHWTHNWDDKTYGAVVLLAELTGKDVYKTAATKWLNYWTVGDNGAKIKYTTGGLAWLDQWGSLRYSANTSLLAFIYADKVGDVGTRYRDFAKSQINYMLGSNPNNRSFEVGFGNNPPINPHHRGAHGSWSNNIANPVNNRHTLYGALVGGPSSADDNAYSDDRSNYVTNEVALDYNAAFTGALARMVSEYGGTPLANFPTAETPDDEFFVEASINSSGSNYTEIRALLNNRSAFPARSSNQLGFRYYVDLTELFAAGYTETSVTVTTNYTQGGQASQLKVYDAARHIYYTEVSDAGTTIVPGSGNSYWKETQFRLTLKSGVPVTAWNPANDYSYVGLLNGNSNTTKTTRIPVYENGKKLSGTEP